MRCLVCGKPCEDTLMLARHTLRSSDHDTKQDWAQGVIANLRASLLVSAQHGAGLSDAMAKGWDST